MFIAEGFGSLVHSLDNLFILSKIQFDWFSFGRVNTLNLIETSKLMNHIYEK